MGHPRPSNITDAWDDGRAQPRMVETLEWHEVRRLVAACESYWLATVGPGPRPHVRPVLGVLDGDEWCTAGSASTVKHRNLAAVTTVTVTAAVEGVDVALEGTAAPVRDPDDLRRVATAYRDKYGWPVEVRDGALDAPYGAPTAGAPPYLVWRVVPRYVYAFGTDDDRGPRSTRFRF